MKIIITILLFILPLSVSAADADGNYAIWGAGKKSCISYTEARESGEYNNYKDYLMGYLTAYNLMAEKTYRISGSSSLEDIIVWLDDYCELKAIHSFEQALTEFIVEHYENRKKSAASFRGR